MPQSTKRPPSPQQSSRAASLPTCFPVPTAQERAGPPRPPLGHRLCLGSGRPQDPRRGGEGRGRQVAGDPPRGCSASEARAQACPLSVGCAPMDQGSSCRRDGPHTRAPAPATSPHLEDDSHDGQVQDLPRRRCRPLVDLVADCGHRRPASRGQAWSKLPSGAAGSYSRADVAAPLHLLATHLLPGRAPACRRTQGPPGPAVPGTAGRRAGGTAAPATAGPGGR